MIAYVGLVYAFIADTFIFDESFATLEIIGIVIILILNVKLILNSFNKTKTESVNKEAIE